jgi:hypothetical protein
MEVLHHALDGQWFAFRNPVMPGYRGDIDVILVGPPGIWALEIKNLSGEHRNVGDDWQVRAGKGWKSTNSPSAQARRNAGTLAGFLKADHIDQWVNGAVVWANTESPLTVENPSLAVWTLDRLPDELGNIWSGSPMPDPARQRIIEKLSGLCKPEEK